jgi:hypothetical protein
VVSQALLVFSQTTSPFLSQASACDFVNIIIPSGRLKQMGFANGAKKWII